MSDYCLTQEEIEEILADTENAEFEKNKAWVLKEIENLGIVDVDGIGSPIKIDALISVIKIIKEYERLKK